MPTTLDTFAVPVAAQTAIDKMRPELRECDAAPACAARKLQHGSVCELIAKATEQWGRTPHCGAGAAAGR